jgi:hypothetical protein
VGKPSPEHCEKGGPDKAATKAERLKCLKDSFDYGNRVLATITAQNTRSPEWKIRMPDPTHAWELP